MGDEASEQAEKERDIKAKRTDTLPGWTSLGFNSGYMAEGFFFVNSACLLSVSFIN
jgi:hypothetical protein